MKIHTESAAFRLPAMLLSLSASSLHSTNAWINDANTVSWNGRSNARRRFVLKGHQASSVFPFLAVDEIPSTVVAKNLPSMPPLHSSVDTTTANIDDIDAVLAQFGMPWRSSIQTPLNGDERASPTSVSSRSSSSNHDVFYMPFFEWQLDFMKGNLNNLRTLPTSDRHQTQDLTYVENLKRHKRMITVCFESDEYRLIRMTLLDGGTAAQVFTSLWYPRVPHISSNIGSNGSNEHGESSSNLPVLGIDLLQFNRQQRHLTVVDFQPIPNAFNIHAPPRYDQNDTLNSDGGDKTFGPSSSRLYFEDRLRPIRDLYPALQHRMSDRFYDESDGFFSSQMLLGKGSNTPDYVWSELWPAYKDYVRVHVEMVKEECRKYRSSSISNGNFRHVLEGHKRYDDYSSVRDPAHGLLASAFGRQYADDFVYDVLFPLSDGIPSESRMAANATRTTS